MSRLARWIPRSTKGRILAAALIGSVIAAVLGWRWAFATWKIRQAREALVSGDIAGAISELESAERIQPDRAELVYLLGRAYRRNDQMEKVLPYLQRAGDLGWPEKDLRHQRYLTLAQVGRFDYAGPYFREILRKGADDELAEEIYEAQAKGYLKTYRLADALVCLRYWVQWRPKAVQPHLWLADIWLRVDDHKSAVRELKAVLETEPNHASANRMLADSLMELQRVEEAKRHYERSVAVDPDDLTALIGIARCERRLANATSARQHFRKLLQRELSAEQRADVLLELGQMELVDVRDAKAAITLLKQAEEIAPHNHLIHASLAGAYRRIGRTKLAAIHDAKVKDIEKNFNRLTEITRQLIRTPNKVELRFEAGMIFMKQGLKKAGVDWLKTVLVYDRHHRKTRLALARYYDGIGEKQTAQRHRELAQSPSAE
ncbi:MAG: tetratricopeptide repeat protein [Planctomycetaceae bacterium]